MPAVLEFADDPEDWVTLWPRTNQAPKRGVEPGPDGLYPKWDGKALARRRARMTPVVWARVYQQQQIAVDSVFTEDMLKGCTNGQRQCGLIPAGMPGNRPEGMGGLIVVAGLDPATTGNTAAVVIGLDPRTQMRYVLDVRNAPGLGARPERLRQLIYDLTEKYAISEWVIEKNAFQGFLVNDLEVRLFLQSHGCIVRPHFTGSNKHDEDFGVAAMTGLFNGWESGHNRIELPSAHLSEPMKALNSQLLSWQPQMQKKQKSDTVMALWMAELACQAKILALSGNTGHHRRNPFATRADKARQRVVNLSEMAGRY